MDGAGKGNKEGTVMPKARLVITIDFEHPSPLDLFTKDAGTDLFNEDVTALVNAMEAKGTKGEVQVDLTFADKRVQNEISIETQH